MRIQLRTCSCTDCGRLPPDRFRVRTSGLTQRSRGGRRASQVRGYCSHQISQQAVFAGRGGGELVAAVDQGRTGAARKDGARSRRVGVTAVAAATGYRWTAIVKRMGTHRTTGKQGNQPDRDPTQRSLRHRTNLSRPKPDSVFFRLFKLPFAKSPWDMRRLSGIFGHKVHLTRIFLQIPAQIGSGP